MSTLWFCLALSTAALADDDDRREDDEHVAAAQLPTEVLAAVQARVPGAVVRYGEREGSGWEVKITTAEGAHRELRLSSSELQPPAPAAPTAPAAPATPAASAPPTAPR